VNLRGSIDYDDDDFEAAGEVDRPKTRRYVIFLSAFVIAGIGSTYAGNISIGNSGPLEFGQGIQVTSACDSSIDVKPLSTFKNDTQTPGVIFSGVRISDVDAACKEKLFVLKAYSETGAALRIDINESNQNYKFKFGNSGWSSLTTGCLSFQNQTYNSPTSNSVDASISGCLDFPFWKDNFSFANKIYRLTLESRENTVKQFTINYAKGDGRTFGWVYDTGDQGGTNGHNSSTNSHTMRPDTVKTKYLSVYVQLTNPEFNSPSTVASMFTISNSGGASCRFAGVAEIGTPTRSPGITSGFYWNSIKGAEFVCLLESDGSVTIS
jgi:hypothetical protein